MLNDLLTKYILDPNNPDHNYNLGIYYESIDQTASALSYFLRCAERSSSPEVQYECLLRASSCFQKQGKRNFTVKGLLQHAISILPKRPEAYYLLSRFYEGQTWDGSWHDSYMIASIGEKVADAECEPLRNPVDYPGLYGITFQKAVAAWWCGLCEESRDLFLQLNKNPNLNETIKQAVQNNITNLNIKEQTMNRLDQTFDWGPLSNEYKDIIYKEIFVDKMYEKFYKVKNEDVVVDIGASCGAFSYSLKDSKPKHVFCIEPSIGLFPILQKNLQNNISCTLINKGISDIDSEVCNKKNTNIIYNDFRNYFSAIKFDSFVKQYNVNKINLLKFDCEGGEFFIFNKENLSFIINNIDNIAGEYHIIDDDSLVYFKNFRDLYLNKLRKTNSLHIFDRDGKCITNEIFDDNYLKSFYDWHSMYAPDRAQFIIYANFECLKNNTDSMVGYYTDSRPDQEFGIIETNNFLLNEQNSSRFFVVDNFYDDPVEVRKFALSQIYFPGEGAVGHRTRKQFLFDGVKEKFEQIIQKKIIDHTPEGHGWKDIGINGRFQYCEAGTPLVYHCDAQQWAGMVYLTPDAPPSCGTSFFRHKKTKIYHNSQIDWASGQGSEVFNQHTFVDRTPYEMVDSIGNVFNRLVIFDGGLIHSASEYFGWDIFSSRLFHMFFFNTSDTTL